jgi:hypothetical protein
VGANRAYLTDLTPSVVPAPGRKHVRMPIQRIATDIEKVQGDDAQCTKLIRDGQLYLLYNGTMYNVQGQIVK